MVKNIFFEKKFHVVWKYAQMHQNTFLTTPDVQKYLFLEKSFWWSRNLTSESTVFPYRTKHHLPIHFFALIPHPGGGKGKSAKRWDLGFFSGSLLSFLPPKSFV
jgi:hypothetical protein